MRQYAPRLSNVVRHECAEPSCIARAEATVWLSAEEQAPVGVQKEISNCGTHMKEEENKEVT